MRLRFAPALFPEPNRDPERDIAIVALAVYRERRRWYGLKRICRAVEPVEVTQVHFHYGTGEVTPGNLDDSQFSAALRYLLTGRLHA